MSLNQNKESLYNGSKLTQDLFDDFLDRLKYHCRGEGVNYHHTAEALFIVEKKVRIVGLDTNYTEDRCIVDSEDCQTYYTMEDFIEALDDDYLEYYGLTEDKIGESFIDMDSYYQWETLEDCEKLTVTGYAENWEYVSAHFTKEAAERFILRKKHDYPAGLRVFVDAQIYCWEFNTIKNALMDGRICYNKEHTND